MISFHKSIDQNLLEDSILFIGDSITQGLAVSAVAPQTVNYGIGNDTTLGVINRLPLYSSINTAKFVVIAIGHNDINLQSEAKIINNFREILNSFSVNVKVILNAVHPVDENIPSLKITNKQISTLNEHLLTLSKAYLNVVFVNIEKSISPYGNLLAKFHTGDGVHLSKMGYDIWIKKLKLTIESLED